MKRGINLCVAIVLITALPVMADWSSAESEDFELDTTIPEPGTIVVILAGAIWCASRRER